jgi:hypothetical protein
MKTKKNTIIGGIFTVLVVFGLVFTACGSDLTNPPPGGDPQVPIPDPATPAITSQPQGAVYKAGTTAQALSVTATRDDEGTLSYQWYKNNANSNENGTLISGATNAHYTPPTNTNDTSYYYVVVTNTLNGKTAKTTSNAAEIVVNNLVNAAVPAITDQPLPLYNIIGEYAGTLRITADVNDEGTLSYQWYSNTAESNTGGTAIPGETESSYTPPVTTTGAFIYYVVVTNTITDNGDGGNKTAQKASDIAFARNYKRITIRMFVDNKVYDGTTTATVSKIEIDGLDAGEEASINPITARAMFSNKNVGTGKTVTPSGTWTLDTSKEGWEYYMVTRPENVTADISAKPVTISGLSANNKVYDGSPSATVSGTPVVDGKASADTVTVNAGTAKFEFEDKNISNGKNVICNGYTLGGTDAGNYTLTQPNLTANITAKPVTITGLSVQNKVYDGTTTATVSGTAVISGVISGDTVTAITGNAVFEDANAGTGKTVIGWSLGGSDAGNYTLTQPNLKATISKAAGASVSQPTVNGKPTSNSITVNAVSLQTSTGQNTEYAISTANNETNLPAWQNGTVFNGLNSGTIYYVYARSASHINYEAGTATVSAGIRTNVTVTFNSNGGADVSSQPLSYDEKAVKPTDPTRTFTGAITHFRGWYTDNTTFANAFNFDTAITSDIILYADWGYRPGDTGPGGGKIFYRDEAGFTHYTSRTDNVGIKAYYLEAAPVDIPDNLKWASPEYYSTNVSNTEGAIGTGKRNTARILFIDTNAPAAKACSEYSNNGITDWFLPSIVELNQLYVNRNAVGIPYKEYWSSTQESQYSAYTYDFPYIKEIKEHSCSVRAIRAF